MTPLADAVAMLNAAIQETAEWGRDINDPTTPVQGVLTVGALQTLLAALPTEAERAAIDNCAAFTGDISGNVEDRLTAEAVKDYLHRTRTGGAT